MNASISDVDLDAINTSHQMCYSGITPGQPLGCNNNLEGLNLSATWDSPQYSEMASPSSQSESTGPSDASLSPTLGSTTSRWAEPCRELFENRDFSGSGRTTDITTNDEFENNLTEYLTANDMSIYDLIAVSKNNLVTENLTNDIPYDKTINNITNAFTINQHRSNDTTMDNYMANYPQDMYWGSIMPIDPEMSTEPAPAPSNTNDDNFDDEVENSSTVSFDDPSSDVNPAGEHRPGYRWCCDEWKKHDGNFKKHLNTHYKQVPCEAGCSERFADNKARNRHYWVSHKKYAKKKKIPNEKCFCEPCDKSFSRRDNFRRHVGKHHSKESEVETEKWVIDDNHEIVKGESDEYAEVCCLKDTE
ncbi:hypothetical protein N5P37_004592 [Trichoderma harzianum]|nr:hypothetical protein N5P37_004592 [Trichoderma harzianum]